MSPSSEPWSRSSNDSVFEPALSNEEVAFPDLRVCSRNAHIQGGWQDELSLASRLISSVRLSKGAVEAVTGKPYSSSRGYMAPLQAVCNEVGQPRACF